MIHSHGHRWDPSSTLRCVDCEARWPAHGEEMPPCSAHHFKDDFARGFNAALRAAERVCREQAKHHAIAAHKSHPPSHSVSHHDRQIQAEMSAGAIAGLAKGDQRVLEMLPPEIQETVIAAVFSKKLA